MTDDEILLRDIFLEAREALEADSNNTEPVQQSLQVPSSLENLDIAASDTWKSHEDSFKFVCRKIKTRAVEIQNRMKKVTSADILASLKVYVQKHVPVTKRISPKNVSPVPTPVKKRVRFVVPQAPWLENSSSEGIEEDSLLYSIRQWYDPTAASPRRNLSEAQPKIQEAFLDTDRMDDQRRSDYVTEYNNPFDQRLTFGGFADHITKPGGEPEENDPGGNILLWLEKVSDVVDECLQKYTRYLKSLRDEPFIVKKASVKSELLKSTLTETPKDSGSENSKVAGDMSEEDRLIRKICSVRKIWDESHEVHGYFIPRRITSRKPAFTSRRRTPVVSEIKPSAWPNCSKLSTGTVDKLSTEELNEEPLHNTAKEVEDGSHFTPTEPVENEQKAPSIWQKIAKEHIDEESLKHIQNATKERAGVKIMRSTLSGIEQNNSDESVKTLNSKISAFHVQAKQDSWAARVAQKANPVSASSSSSQNKSNHLYVRDMREPQKPCTEHKSTIPSKTVSFLASTVKPVYSEVIRPRDYTTIIQDISTRPSAVITTSQSVVTTAPSTECPVKPNYTPVSTTWKDVASTSRSSGPNQLNSSTDWYKRLAASNRECSVDIKQTLPSYSATVLSSSTNEHSVKESRPTAESKSELNTGVHQNQAHPAQEFRHRPPPGFEKTILENRIPPPSGAQPTRAVHVPPGHHWQIPGAVYAGVGETFVQSTPSTYQPEQPRILHQFQRPIAQVGGNLAIWHPRPNHGSYMLTDVNGKAIGMGIPTWNRVDLQGRPHVFVHQATVNNSSTLRAAVRQPHIFPTGPTDNYVQQTFTNKIPPTQHLPHPKLTDPRTPSSGPSTGCERGDHFPGYYPSGMPIPQANYPGGRLVPQFIPTVHQVPSMIQEYALFTPNQLKLNPPYLRPHYANTNNNASSNSEGPADVMDTLNVNRNPDHVVARRPGKVFKVSRVVRTNLIQLA